MELFKKGITSNFIKPGKINMIIDGSFGSTGKGLIASRIAIDNFYHISISSLSPNAGHTFYQNGVKKITKLLPVTGICGDRKNIIYLSAGSVIDVDILLNEIEEFNIDINKIKIHPNAAIITEENKIEEQIINGVEKIASTQSGTGSARASKIMRKNPLAKNIDKLKNMISILNLHKYLDMGLNIIVETGQGVDLGLDHGFMYPYVTSRDVLPAHVLADLGVHPNYMGNTMLTFRTYPIRVGNIIRDGVEIGNSGPYWDDQREITWKDLNVEPELTTVTKRIRRILTFSKKQYLNSINLVKPTHIFLNFVNYVKKKEDVEFFKNLLPKPNFIGIGPNPNDVLLFEKFSDLFNNIK